MARKHAEDGNLSPVTVLEGMIRNLMPGVYRLANNGGGGLVGLQVKHRGEGDWLVIIKSEDSDSTPTVLFGFGVDLFSSLLAADHLVQAGQWREDRPWVPGQ